ncbi:MAG: hypothetical protein ABIO76_09675, partial [Ginsengibacter sp.]
SACANTLIEKPAGNVTLPRLYFLYRSLVCWEVVSALLSVLTVVSLLPLLQLQLRQRKKVANRKLKRWPAVENVNLIVKDN